ncbi:MAG: glycine--tRNA ligase subunit beta [Betaproteobacteria bacterium]
MSAAGPPQGARPLGGAARSDARGDPTSAATLLVELLTEELPPKGLKRLSEAFAREVHDALRTRDFVGARGVVTVFATPRRLAVTITDVLATASDKPFKEKLLPVSVAFDASGKPTPALIGKLKARQLSHLDPSTLGREHDGKAEVLFYADVAKGGPLATALQAALDEAISALPIAKVMSYTGAGGFYNDRKFVRPAHGLVALHGADIVPVRALGLEAGRVSAGHRFLGRADLHIASADAYEPTLEAEGKVIASFDKRRAEIVAALEQASEHARVIMPDALLDEVTALVEWPAVYPGTFDRAFLEVPQECLILTMQQNQKYFALADDAGALRHRFLLVSNLRCEDPSAIVHGNERVLRARLADARFFYDQDRRTSLESRVERLRGVVYHNKLGSNAERVDRLVYLAKKIAPLLGADPAHAERGALLAKADLVTDMVAEFPELQGTMGRYYALHDGEPAVVANAIEQHYWPKVAGGALPEDPVAQSVALADKLESLVGMFGIGQAPTGDKDPMGLRRAALGVIRILIERAHRVSLPVLADLAFDAFNAIPAVTREPGGLLDFIYDRLRGYLRDQGYTTLEVAAVVDAHPEAIDNLPARLAAVRAFGMLPEAESLASANKRIANILKKSGGDAAASVDRALLNDGAEHDLYAAVQVLLPLVHGHVHRGDYTEALRALASARGPVDRFFDDVMVMADDRALRANRLALLRGLAEAMNQVADISKLAA